MDSASYIKDYLKFECDFSICKCLDVWGEKMLYYGCFASKIYTDGYQDLKELVKEYPELKKAIY